MRSTIRSFESMAILVFAFAGCRSHQARVDVLQKEYDQLGEQFQKDCSAEYLKVPPTLSPRCSDERDKLEAVGRQLRAERAKQ